MARRELSPTSLPAARRPFPWTASRPHDGRSAPCLSTSPPLLSSPLDLGVMPSELDAGVARRAVDRAGRAGDRPDDGARVPRTLASAGSCRLRIARVQRQRHPAGHLARHRAEDRAERRSHPARSGARRRRVRLHAPDHDSRRGRGLRRNSQGRGQTSRARRRLPPRLPRFARSARGRSADRRPTRRTSTPRSSHICAGRGVGVAAVAHFRPPGRPRSGARLRGLDRTGASCVSLPRLEVQAVFVSCTSLRVAEAAAKVERLAGAPVTSSQGRPLLSLYREPRPNLRAVLEAVIQGSTSTSEI